VSSVHARGEASLQQSADDRCGLLCDELCPLGGFKARLLLALALVAEGAGRRRATAGPAVRVLLGYVLRSPR